MPNLYRLCSPRTIDPTQDAKVRFDLRTQPANLQLNDPDGGTPAQIDTGTGLMSGIVRHGLASHSNISSVSGLHVTALRPDDVCVDYTPTLVTALLGGVYRMIFMQITIAAADLQAHPGDWAFVVWFSLPIFTQSQVESATVSRMYAQIDAIASDAELAAGAAVNPITFNAANGVETIKRGDGSTLKQVRLTDGAGNPVSDPRLSKGRDWTIP